MNTLQKTKNFTLVILAIFLILISVLPSKVQASDNGDVLVYITETGECYHRGDCSYLKSRIEISLRDAVNSGYRACSRCHPPSLSESSTTTYDTAPYKTKSYSDYDYDYESKPEEKQQSIPATPFIIMGIAIAVIVYIVVRNGINKKKRRKADLEAKERFEKEKLEFINLIANKGIRNTANVPANIRFINGYPVDNNNSNYGSYTVYKSSNGRCYHKKQGCCSASKPIHCFKAKNDGLNPCSRCNTPNISIPQWYYDYIELKNKCELYDINVDED